MAESIQPEVRSFAGWPRWVWIGGLLLALGYLPMLTAPFDFIDDGNLVYPTRGLTLGQHASLWWEKVAANVDHLGPFRPVVWAHWHLAANCFDADARLWRLGRLIWCGFAGVLLLGWLHEWKVGPMAALIASAAALWNPYRNEFWTSLTLAEGVAMPYALLALLACRKAAFAVRPAGWDWLALLGFLAALGCKNTFLALLPAMLFSRLCVPGRALVPYLKTEWWRIALLGSPALLPLVHAIYFQAHWKPGQYVAPGPSWEQAKQILFWLKGASGADFLAPGVLATIGLLVWKRSANASERNGSVWLAGLLLLGGVAVYLPFSIMSARYTIPAIWGFDLLLAVLLTRLERSVAGWPKRVAWGLVGCGLIALVVAGANRQEKLAARSRMLWAMVDSVEANVPRGAKIGWIGGASEQGELNAEEGIHFAWHLLHRGRGDIRIGLYHSNGEPYPRVELPGFVGPFEYRISANGGELSPEWLPMHRSVVRYRFGAKCHEAILERRAGPGDGTGHALDALKKYLIEGLNPAQSLLPAESRGPQEAKRK